MNAYFKFDLFIYIQFNALNLISIIERIDVNRYIMYLASMNRLTLQYIELDQFCHVFAEF